MVAQRFTLRSGTPEDFDNLFLVLSRAFNDDPDDEEREDERQVFEPERAILVEADGVLAGTAAAYTRDLTVPGGVVPAAHVTMVGVDPTFRRQRVLTRMITHQLADVRARGEVMVREVVTATTEAYRSIWHHLLTVDLTRSTSWWYGAVDEPLQFLVDEPRRLGSRMGDALWVRLVDLPAALAARRYAAPVDVVLEVDDPLLPDNSGTWHLAGDPAGAKCAPADRPAELRCEIGALAAAYLGDASLTTLAAAGRVHELVPGTLAAAATAFGWPRPPSAVEIF